jgi:hypothetical protein
MAEFNFHDEKLVIVDTHDNSVELSPQEAAALLHWLSNRSTALLDLSHEDTNMRDRARRQVQIRLMEQHLMHLDALKAAIPQLQEHIPATNTFAAPVDAVTERAFQLLKAYQIEYKIHPLLDDTDDAFAQG